MARRWRQLAVGAADARAHPNEQMLGVMMPASTAAGVLNLGIVLAGKVPVNLNFTVGREALESALEQCAIKTIYTSEKFLEKAKIERRGEMRFAEQVLQFAKAGAGGGVCGGADSARWRCLMPASQG